MVGSTKILCTSSVTRRKARTSYLFFTLESQPTVAIPLDFSTHSIQWRAIKNQAAATPAWEGIGLLVVGLPLLVLIVKFGRPNQRIAVNGWASSNNYKLIEAKQCFIRQGSFFRMRCFAYDAVVWYVRVLAHDGPAREGPIRHAWLRLSCSAAMQTGPDVEVRLDEKHDQHLLR